MVLAMLAAAVAPVAHVRATVLGVGLGQTYATISDAVAAASPDDVIDVQAGTYINDFSVIDIPLTIMAVGGTAILRATEAIPNEMGILVTNAAVTIDGLEFQGASIPDSEGGNGAGIRYKGGSLAISDSIFADDQDGILADSDPTGTITIKNSTFLNDGSGSGFTHALYVNMIDSLTVEGSTFEGTRVGHDIKSRAANTIITGNYLDDGVTGTTSYAIDLPNAGKATIDGNEIVQGPDTQNLTMISYGEEGEAYGDNFLLVAGNTFINTRPGGSIGVDNHTSDVSAMLEGNIFDGVADPLVGPGGSSPPELVEPSALALIGSGLAALGLVRRRLHRKPAGR